MPTARLLLKYCQLKIEKNIVTGFLQNVCPSFDSTTASKHDINKTIKLVNMLVKKGDILYSAFTNVFLL